MLIKVEKLTAWPAPCTRLCWEARERERRRESERGRERERKGHQV